MNQQTSPTVTGVPPAFLNRFGHSITGVLSGFDRLRLRGTLRHLFQPTVMEAYLNACRILIKDFGTFAQGLTARIKAAAYATAQQAGRPFRYLPSSQISKEALARQIARADGVTSGLIAIFSALENCLSYSVRGDRQTKHIHMVLEPRKCLHLYHYFAESRASLSVMFPGLHPFPGRLVRYPQPDETPPFRSHDAPWTRSEARVLRHPVAAEPLHPVRVD